MTNYPSTRNDSVFACVVAVVLFAAGCAFGAYVGYAVSSTPDAASSELAFTLRDASAGKAPEHPRSSKWPHVRDTWLESHPTCEACGTDEHVEIHHVKSFTYYPELELDTSNFMSLCRKPGHNCHLRIGHSGDWKSWNPHAREDAALMLKRQKERKYSR